MDSLNATKTTLLSKKLNEGIEAANQRIDGQKDKLGMLSSNLEKKLKNINKKLEEVVANE